MKNRLTNKQQSYFQNLEKEWVQYTEWFRHTVASATKCVSRMLFTVWCTDSVVSYPSAVMYNFHPAHYSNYSKGCLGTVRESQRARLKERMGE